MKFISKMKDYDHSYEKEERITKVSEYALLIVGSILLIAVGFVGYVLITSLYL